MKQLSLDSHEFIRQTAKPRGLDQMARRLIHARLAKITNGQIVISEKGQHSAYGKLTAAVPLTAHISVDDPQFYRDVAFGGSIGAGEAYIHGHWSCGDLSNLLRILLRNREVLDDVDSGTALFTRPLQKLFHFFNRNTRKGSRRNIAAHYDLGNDFYRLWLDPKMMYSCAYFESTETTLEDASISKLDRICRKLDLSADDEVVEIGTGWGGFAMHAAKHYGCHVTTTTISKQQFEYARLAVAAAGLQDRVTLLLDDYRDLQGKFDKLVSIEMIEAVGHEFHDSFFRKCSSLLKPDGQMLIQAITIADQRYERYKTGVDFIKRYIFPGGCLTSVTDMCRTMTTQTDMRMHQLEDIGPHYATTLRHWRDRFNKKLGEVRGQGYSEEFIRLWQFYLSYCESAFLERAIGTVQLLAMKPEARRNSLSF
jgi:cyclopropane-fatty-acyl-phospholipid synthase